MTSPTGVETGADTPPTASANAVSSRASGAASPDVRSTRAMVVSIGCSPSFFASAMKSDAAWSGGRSSSAFALGHAIPRLGRQAGRGSAAATSFRGLRPPSWMSTTLIAWKPNGVRTGSGVTSPFFSAKSAFSNSGTISPLPTQPQVAAARRRRRILGDLLRQLAEVRAGLRPPDDVDDLGARLVLRVAAPGLGDTREDVGGADLARGLELAGVLGVVLLDLRVGRRRREVLRVQGHVLHAAPVGLAKLVGVLREVGGELLVGGVGAGDDRGDLDERPRRAHLFAPEAVRLLELGRRHLDAVADRGLDLRARELTAGLGFERGSGVAAPLQESPGSA